ncbi:MAG: BglG family transcription antiterminator [Eubacteriaceae bacterium]|jgi:mannitol operon transcriptional antiterminator
MNKRTISIIKVLDASDDAVTIGELSDQFQVSTRTIRNDINTINDFLSENELPLLSLEKGGRIAKSLEFGQVRSLVKNDDFYSYKLSRDERMSIASAMLVSSPGYLTLSAIADSLFVSRATVISDLNGIKDYIKSGNLTVTSHPNKGLRVEGLESDKRLFLMQINMSGGQPGASESVIASRVSIQSGDSITIQKILSEQEHQYKSFLTDESFRSILLYLGIMVNRNLQGEYIEPRKKIDNFKYRMAQDTLKYMTQYCGIHSTEDEVQFLSEILTSARYIKQDSSEKEPIKIQLMTRQFIEQVSDELEINLNNDYDFYENLSNHLESILSVIPTGYPETEVVDEVLEDNPEIVEAVTNNLSSIENYAGRPLESIEISYIAIHICAALERKKNKEIVFHVIVACHAGIGTSQLLMEKLKKHFNFQIVDVISSHEAKNIQQDAADFIISTVPLEGCRLEYVVVSPMLSDEDYIRVGNKIDTLRNSRNLPSRIGERELTARGMIERLRPIIQTIAPEQAEALIPEIRKAVRSYFKQPAGSDTDIFAPSLHHLLPASHIQLDVTAHDWREAVRKSAAKLLERGYIEERYIDAMIHNIDENGQYIVLTDGFAFPHEGLEQGSVKVGMNLIRLQEPVHFDDEDLKPVDLVCCLSAVDHKTHLKAFFNLVNILQTDTFKKEIHQVKTPEEAAALIEKYEYTLES